MKTYSEALITCYGKDRHIHACKPSEKVAVCGMPVTQKDNIEFTNRFWCYECDAALDSQESELEEAE